MSAKVFIYSKLVYREPPSSIILDPAENHSLHTRILLQSPLTWAALLLPKKTNTKNNWYQYDMLQVALWRLWFSAGSRMMESGVFLKTNIKETTFTDVSTSHLQGYSDFRTLALKMTRASGRNVGKRCFPLSWSLENHLVPSSSTVFQNMTFYSTIICSTS